MTDVTRILAEVDEHKPGAAEALLGLVYDELRKLAAARLAHERPGQTLEATALVHEAWLRLVDASGQAKATGHSDQWAGRGHFFAAAAEAMRRILIDRARRRATVKHGGGRARVDLEAVASLADGAPSDNLIALDEALTRLAAEDPDKAQLVKLRYFAGLTMREAAAALGISLATAERRWTFARSWLFAELTPGDSQL